MILPSIWVVTNRTARMFPKILDKWLVTLSVLRNLLWLVHLWHVLRKMSTFAEPILVSRIVQVARNQHELHIIHIIHMGVSINGGTPSYHPYFHRSFPYKPSSYWGTPMTQETSTSSTSYDLVGALEHFLLSHILGIIIIPIDELIFFRGVAQPPTSGLMHVEKSMATRQKTHDPPALTSTHQHLSTWTRPDPPVSLRGTLAIGTWQGRRQLWDGGEYMVNTGLTYG